MAPIHTILHPTDFSGQSAYALRLACSLARDYDARLVVLHVVEPPAQPYEQGVLLPLSDFVAEAQGELERLVVPADAAEVGKLASHYVSPALGALRVRAQDGAAIFDFGNWRSTVASRGSSESNSWRTCLRSSASTRARPGLPGRPSISMCSIDQPSSAWSVCGVAL